MNIWVLKLAGRVMIRQRTVRFVAMLAIIFAINCAISSRCQPQNAPANAKPSASEINLKAKCFEITVDSRSEEGLGAVLSNFTDVVLVTNHAPNYAERDTITAILNDQQYRSVLQTLPKRDWVEALTFPEVTTERGRRVEMLGTENSPVATPSRAGTPPAGASATTNMPSGQASDVTPEIGPDGYSIHLVLRPSITDFVGYDNPGQFVPQASIPTGGTITAVLPLPHFRSREWAAGATAWDGQTVVVSQVLASYGPVVTPGDDNWKVKLMLVFVTPTIVNPDGTRQHSLVEMNAPRFANPPPPFSTNASRLPEKGPQ